MPPLRENDPGRRAAHPEAKVPRPNSGRWPALPDSWLPPRRHHPACAAPPPDSRGPRHRGAATSAPGGNWRSEEHTSELQSRFDLVCRLLLEKKKTSLPTAEFIFRFYIPLNSIEYIFDMPLRHSMSVFTQ